MQMLLLVDKLGQGRLGTGGLVLGLGHSRVRGSFASMPARNNFSLLSLWLSLLLVVC